jgi:uncharacterized phage-associated protein
LLLYTTININTLMKKNKYNPYHIANYILWRAWKENIEITPMKLIKLIYIAYGWNLVINNDSPLFDEKILAWKYGPVIPSIYHEFKRFGNLPIPKGHYATDFDIERGEIESVPIVPEDDQDVLRVLNALWGSYKNKSGIELSKITHQEGGAWDKAYKKGAGENQPLNDFDIKRRSLEAINSLIEQSKNT